MTKEQQRNKLANAILTASFVPSRPPSAKPSANFSKAVLKMKMLGKVSKTLQDPSLGVKRQEGEVKDLDEWCPAKLTWQSKERARKKREMKEAALRSSWTAQQAYRSADMLIARSMVEVEAAIQRCIKAQSEALAVARQAAINTKDIIPEMDSILYIIRAKIAAKYAAQASASASLVSVLTLSHLKPVFDIVATWEHAELLRFLQQRIDEKLGDTCPCVSIRIEQKEVEIKRALNFEGGCATIVEADMEVMQQVSKSILAIFTSIDKVNDKLEAKGQDRSFEMLHLRVEGHVHKGKKSTEEKCNRISQERAEEVVKHIIEAGVPPRYLHAQGFGARRPKGTADENRRVEIFVMSDGELKEFVKWKFTEYDKDNTGFLSHEQLAVLGVAIGREPDTIPAMIKDLDPTNTGRVGQEELLEWFEAS